MTFLEEELKTVETSPDYCRVLRIYIKHQIYTLFQKLSEIGEESFALTANACDGTFSHVGSSKGEVFLDKTQDIQWKFLSFCSSTDNQPVLYDAEYRIDSDTSRSQDTTYSEKQSPALRQSGTLVTNQQQTSLVVSKTEPDNVDDEEEENIYDVPQNSNDYTEEDNDNYRAQTGGADPSSLYGNMSSEPGQEDSMDMDVQQESYRAASSSQKFHGSSRVHKRQVSYDDFQELPNSPEIIHIKTEPGKDRELAENYSRLQRKSAPSKEVYSASSVASNNSFKRKTNLNIMDSDGTDIDIASQYHYLKMVAAQQDSSLTNETEGPPINIFIDEDLQIVENSALTRARRSNINPMNANTEQQVYPSENIISLKHRMMNYSGSQTRKHVCPLCSKSLTSSGNLRVHMRIHTGERPFWCTQCNKGFTTACNLNTHLRRHTGIKPFKCEVCVKQFSQKEHLQRHQLVHFHSNQSRCPLCSQQFEVGELDKMTNHWEQCSAKGTHSYQQERRF